MRGEGGRSITVYENKNNWDLFIAVHVREINRPSNFIIIPGGTSGEQWLRFATWLVPESRKVQATAAAYTPVLGRSFADVVRSPVAEPGISALMVEIRCLRSQLE